MNKIDLEALEYHSSFPPGKLSISPTKPAKTQNDLSLAYTPGVAAPCLEIEKDAHLAYKYTNKGNLVAVISNGTAVLGLGNIGALSGKPVMEGKGLLFKVLSGIDSIDIEVDTEDTEEFCKTVKNIAAGFGGINLEDIKAPECFIIEETLKNSLNIPVMHDDQHGTAIISSAALLNALELAGKNIGDIRLVINGAGAAAIAGAYMYIKIGVKKENIIMCDSKGVVRKDRSDLNEYKRFFAVETEAKTLEEALKGADVFAGFSKGGVVSKEMIGTMAASPVIMAMANPVPEINYDEAKSAREDAIICTGRSDYPNQVNNVLGFPYIFRGALDTRAKEINDEMKIAAAHAIADLAKEPVPEEVLKAYGLKSLVYGADYIIPKPLDGRLLEKVSIAVAKAAMASGAAREEISDWEAYKASLRLRMKSF